MLVGDSLAVGLRADVKKRCDAACIRFTSDARGGTTLRQWSGLKWFEQALSREHPDVVVVSLGTNDGIPRDRQLFGTRIKKLMELSSARNIRLVWLMPPKMPFKMGPIWAAIEESGVEFLDPRCVDLPRWKDGIHMRPKANELWAQMLWELLATRTQRCR